MPTAFLQQKKDTSPFCNLLHLIFVARMVVFYNVNTHVGLKKYSKLNTSIL